MKSLTSWKGPRGPAPSRRDRRRPASEPGPKAQDPKAQGARSRQSFTGVLAAIGPGIGLSMASDPLGNRAQGRRTRHSGSGSGACGARRVAAGPRAETAGAEAGQGLPRQALQGLRGSPGLGQPPRGDDPGAGAGLGLPRQGLQGLRAPHRSGGWGRRAWDFRGRLSRTRRVEAGPRAEAAGAGGSPPSPAPGGGGRRAASGRVPGRTERRPNAAIPARASPSSRIRRTAPVGRRHSGKRVRALPRPAYGG